MPLKILDGLREIISGISAMKLLIIAALVISLIFIYYVSVHEGFSVVDILQAGYPKPVHTPDINMLNRSPDELSYEDTLKNDAGGYVEFYTPNKTPTQFAEYPNSEYNFAICSDNTYSSMGPNGVLFNITTENNIFKYNHLNDKVFTITIPVGVYDGEKLAEVLDKTLNKADEGWWVVWNEKKKTFHIGTFDFRYSRYMHPRSIYKTIGLTPPEQFGLLSGTTDWFDSESGTSCS